MRRTREGVHFIGLSLILTATWVPFACGHETGHEYAMLDNGVVKCGREANAGGAITWLSEKDGLNLINNWDFGRQCQVAIFDTLAWNPTQAGDGPNPAITEVFTIQPQYVYSRCIPLHFVPLSYYMDIPEEPPEPRICHNQRIHMWTEFLPNAEGRALWIRTLYENSSDHDGKLAAQVLSPCVVANDYFEKVVAYSDAQPWTNDDLADHVDPDSKDLANLLYPVTELWQGLIDNENYGIFIMSSTAYGGFMDHDAPGPPPPRTGDHMWPCQTIMPLDYFCPALNPGENVQIREGGIILYLGDLEPARAFLNTYRPRIASDMSDDFDDGDFSGWAANTHPIEVRKKAVKMGPYSGYSQDLSLLRRYYGDASVSVRMKLDSETGWCGIVIRKPGESHHTAWGIPPTGYTVALTSDRELTVTAEGALMASVPLPDVDPRKWHAVKVEAAGFELQIDLDGTRRLTVMDPKQRFENGFVSLAASDGAAAWFDDFQVAGSAGDGTPPAEVADFVVSACDEKGSLDLQWTNPEDDDWRFTRIVRKEGTRPANPYDGFPCYEGKLSAYRDAGIDTGKQFFYAAYAMDHAGNYADPAHATVASEQRN